MHETHYDFTDQKVQLALWQRLAEFWSIKSLNPLDRQQIQQLLLDSPLAQLTQGTILDLASGNSPYHLNHHHELETVHVDLAHTMLTKLKDSEPKVQGTAIKLPFASQSFNGVANICMMRYLLPNQQKDAIQEMVRVTKPGGSAVIIDFDAIQNVGKVANFDATAHQSWLSSNTTTTTSHQRLIPASFEAEKGHKPVFLEILTINVK